MMRVLLALLAVLGLMLSPLAASAASRHCSERDGAMMAMASAHDAGAMGAMDCCPHGKPGVANSPAKPAQAKHDRSSCANACAAIAMAVAALPASAPMLVAVAQPVRLEPGLATSLTAHDPPRLERPPRSIA